MSIKDYADSFRAAIAAGESIDDLNRANHYALEQGMITLEMFQSAARVIARAFIDRD